MCQPLRGLPAFAGMTSEDCAMSRNHRDHDAEMGPDDDRGQDPRLAQAARATSYRAGEELLEIETTKITNVMEARRGRHACAGSWRRPVRPCRSARLLAVVAPDEVPDARDRRLCRRVVAVPSRQPKKRPKPRPCAARDRGRRPAPALPRTRRAATVSRSLLRARLRRRSQHLDVHPAGAGRRPADDRPGPAGAW